MSSATAKTRREAYEMSKLDPANNRQRVLAYLHRSRTGATCDEIEVLDQMRYGKDGMQFSTAGAIILDLRKEGLVAQSTTQRFRKTRRGRRAVVWTLLATRLPENKRQLARTSALENAARAVVIAYEERDVALLRIAIEMLRQTLNGRNGDTK